jgi:RNA 3'-terminal phosphate cyclase (ATP)
MIEINGATGEGGGQVLRTALSLATLRNTPFHLFNIRSGRKQPGLQAQHLAAVLAAAKISQASVQGAHLGSSELIFEPKDIRSGRYRFAIKTAGSTSLVLQTIALPLSQARSASSVTLVGGTHVPWSPCSHYLAEQWLPWLRAMGWDILFELELAGFFPEGGGKVSATIRPIGRSSPLDLRTRGSFQGFTGTCGVANLDGSIADRMKRQAVLRLQKIDSLGKTPPIHIKTATLHSPTKGAFVQLMAKFANGRGCFTALGAPGKPAERVADEAVDDLWRFLDSSATVDPFLADQLLLPMALATGTSVLATSAVTSHQLTNAEIIQLFLPVRFDITGRLGEPGIIEVYPQL